jgi:hypothetical protein
MRKLLTLWIALALLSPASAQLTMSNAAAEAMKLTRGAGQIIVKRACASSCYDSELRPTTLRGCWRWCLKNDSGHVVLAPDSFANVNCLEVVQAKFELIGQ